MKAITVKIKNFDYDLIKNEIFAQKNRALTLRIPGNLLDELDIRVKKAKTTRSKFVRFFLSNLFSDENNGKNSQSNNIMQKCKKGVGPEKT